MPYTDKKCRQKTQKKQNKVLKRNLRLIFDLWMH